MSDQKISSQPEHTTPVLGVDLMALVANTNTTPTNFRVQVKNFLSQIQISLPQTDFSAFKITASVTANANVHIQAAGEFVMIANSALGTIAETKDRYGLISRNIIQNGNSNVLGQCAAGMFELDTGNATTVSGNTYGVVVRHYANTRPRFTAPQAFFGVFEDANTGLDTIYLMDVGAGTKHVSGLLANTDTDVIFSEVGSATASHTLKIRVNGEDLWLLASNIAPI
jgi:hypothetical protein